MTTDIFQLAKEHNGFISYALLLDNNYNKPKIRKLVNDSTIHRAARGLYYYEEFPVDWMRVYQTLNSTVIYSHETVAYLHNLTDRFPKRYSLSVKQGTNLRNRNDYSIFYIDEDRHSLDKTYVINSFGNEIITYDEERTVCDIIRSKERIELQIYLEVLKSYFSNKPNMNKLSNYAKHFNIVDEVYEVSLLLQES